MRMTSEAMTLNSPACRLRPLKLLEVNLFQEGDHFHGLLVLMKAEHMPSGREVTVETHLHPKHYYSVTDSTGSMARLQFLEVREMGLHVNPCFALCSPRRFCYASHSAATK
jgi:hypothetical protein